MTIYRALLNHSSLLLKRQVERCSPYGTSVTMKGAFRPQHRLERTRNTPEDLPG